MAFTVNQVYQMVNDAAKEALGQQAVTVKDTGSLVSLGEQIQVTENVETFYKTLVNRIGRTVVAVRAFEINERSVMRNEMEWGVIYQKISFKPRDAVENPSWDSTNQANPYDIEPQTTVVQKLFSVMGTYSYEDSIPDYQLFTAFTTPAAMAAFISGIYTNMYNYLKIAEANLANLAVNTYMAGAMSGTNAAQKRNLLKEYNDKFTKTLTVEQALTDASFLKFASKTINDTIKQFTSPSAIFNAEGIVRQTTKDKLVVEVLSQFATATTSYMESDTYHNELVKLPRYEEVNYWQASGTGFSFEDVSTIDIQNANINEGAEVKKTGIVAFIHDYDAVASIIYRRRSNSIYNPRAERYNVMEKADKGYAVDLSENGVVFYMAAE